MPNAVHYQAQGFSFTIVTLITHIKTAAPKTDPTSPYSHLGLEKQLPGMQPTKSSLSGYAFPFSLHPRIGQAASQVTAVIRLPSSLSLSRAGCPGQPPGLVWEAPRPLPLRESHCERQGTASLRRAFGHVARHRHTQAHRSSTGHPPPLTSQGYIFEATAPSSPGCY